jgi:hypothetical protein
VNLLDCIAAFSPHAVSISLLTRRLWMGLLDKTVDPQQT